MLKYLLTIMAFAITVPIFAYEDCIITTNGKMTNIKIQHNDIIDVFPMITVMNEKNTLIVHPLKEGETKFTILKNNKDKYLFNVSVTSERTKIDDVKGFDILAIDCPPGGHEYFFDLDEPPKIYENFVENADGYYINNLDVPPALRGE